MSHKFRYRVPDSPRLDRLLRCLNNLERFFDGVLTQYKSAKRLRMGQLLPHQLEVSVMWYGSLGIQQIDECNMR